MGHRRPGSTRACGYRHSAGSRLDGAILSDGEIADWAVNPNAQLTRRAPCLGQPVCIRLHRAEHRLSGFAAAYVLHGILERCSHSVILANELARGLRSGQIYLDAPLFARRTGPACRPIRRRVRGHGQPLALLPLRRTRLRRAPLGNHLLRRSGFPVRRRNQQPVAHRG
jgi:hypothetical protein